MSGGDRLRCCGFAGQQLRVGNLGLALEELGRRAVPDEHQDHAEEKPAEADHERAAEADVSTAMISSLSSPEPSTPLPIGAKTSSALLVRVSGPANATAAVLTST